LQDVPDVDWIRDPRLRPALAALLDHGLRFDALVRPAHLPALLDVMQRYPTLPVVIDHGAKPNIAARQYDDWAHQMRVIARDSAACCKVSGLLTEAEPGVALDVLRPYLDLLLECFGPSRLMWGSDWPVINLCCDYTTWWTMTQEYVAQLDAVARESVLGRTAQRFYGI
jgi:L-fuconolactonase